MSMRRLRQKKRHVAPKCLLHTHSTFSKSVMVFVGVSKLGQIDLIFVDTGVKVCGAYYRDMLLTQKLLSAMREICTVFSTFQQCNATAAAYLVWEIINLLERQMPLPVLLSLHHIFGTQQYRCEPVWLQKMVRNAAASLPSLWHRWTEAALDRCRAWFWAKSSMTQMISGANVSVWVFVWK